MPTTRNNLLKERVATALRRLPDCGRGRSAVGHCGFLVRRGKSLPFLAALDYPESCSNLRGPSLNKGSEFNRKC